MKKAVFLDKDGTLIVDKNYCANPDKVEFSCGALSALRTLSEAGYLLVVISNQPGVGLGKYKESEVDAVARRIAQLLDEEGVTLSGFYFCPHTQQDRCSCRKPGTLLFERAVIDLHIDLRSSWMVGDILNDVEAGHRAGCRSILLNNGNETEWILEPDARRPDFIAADLKVAAEYILTEKSESSHGFAPRPVPVAADLKRWNSAQNVLAVRLDSFGDVLMTGPALRALKSQRAGRRLTLLTSPSGAQAARLMPWVDDVLIHKVSWMKHSEVSPQGDLELIKKISAAGFDASVIFTVFSQSALPAAQLVYLAGVPLRIAVCRENPYSLLTDWLPETDTGNTMRHEVRRQLDLVRVIGCAATDEHLSIVPAAAAKASLHHVFVENNLPSPSNCIVVHPGATAPSRRYPATQFAEVISMLADQGLGPVVLTGAAEEEPLLSSILAECSPGAAIAFAGKLSIDELAVLIGECRLVITNNTGPAHLAAATGTPVVALYALTNPQHVPWKVSAEILFHDVPCRFCYKSICLRGDNRCTAGVSPRHVVNAVQRLLTTPRDQAFQFQSALTESMLHVAPL